MTQPTDPKNKVCKYCPYNRQTLDGLREDCDPPMGECRLESLNSKPASTGRPVKPGHDEWLTLKNKWR